MKLSILAALFLAGLVFSKEDANENKSFRCGSGGPKNLANCLMLRYLDHQLVLYHKDTPFIGAPLEAMKIQRKARFRPTQRALGKDNSWMALPIQGADRLVRNTIFIRSDNNWILLDDFFGEEVMSVTGEYTLTVYSQSSSHIIIRGYMREKNGFTLFYRKREPRRIKKYFTYETPVEIRGFFLV